MADVGEEGYASASTDSFAVVEHEQPATALQQGGQRSEPFLGRVRDVALARAVRHQQPRGDDGRGFPPLKLHRGGPLQTYPTLVESIGEAK